MADMESPRRHFPDAAKRCEDFYKSVLLQLSCGLCFELNFLLFNSFIVAFDPISSDFLLLLSLVLRQGAIALIRQHVAPPSPLHACYAAWLRVSIAIRHGKRFGG